jgi:hypothetical protein
MITAVAPPGAYWADFQMQVTYPDPMGIVFVREVQGLEPVNATVNSREYGLVDGEFYVGSHVGKRNIVIRFGLNTIVGAASVGNARNMLYAYFTPKSNIKLRFSFDDRSDVVIDGYVESLTGNRFSQDPEMQASVICPKPNFLSAEVKQTIGQTGPDDFEALYSGTVESGVEFSVRPGGTAYTGALYFEMHVGDADYRTMQFNGVNIPANWEFYLNTKQGQKQAVTRPINGSQDPVTQLGRLQDVAYWMKLFPALNLVRVRAPGSTTARDWTLTYQDQFAGV